MPVGLRSRHFHREGELVSAITLTQLCDEDHNQTSQLDGETRRIVRSVGQTELAKLVKIDHSQKMRLIVTSALPLTFAQRRRCAAAIFALAAALIFRRLRLGLPPP
jgi:hypothetical protein